MSQAFREIDIPGDKNSLFKQAIENPEGFYASIKELSIYEHQKNIKKDKKSSRGFCLINKINKIGSCESIRLVLIFQKSEILNHTRLKYYTVDQKNSKISDMLIKAIAASESIYILLELYNEINSMTTLIATASAVSVPASHALPIIPSAVTTPIISTSVAATAISSKTILASIIITVLSTGSLAGVYVAEPEVFADTMSLNIIAKGVNFNGDGVSISKTNLSNVGGSTDNANTGSGNKGHASNSVTSNISSHTSVEQTTQVEQTTKIQNSYSFGSGGSSGSTRTGPGLTDSTISFRLGTPVFKEILINATFPNPTDIAFDSNNNIYVVDTGNDHIQVFDSDGNFLFTFGSFCRISTMENCHDPDGDGGPLQLGDGQFSFPNGIAFDSNNNIYVVDAGNDRVQVFDSDGNFVKSFGKSGSNPGEFDSPGGISIDSQDNIVVVESGNSRVQVFDSDGNFVKSFGQRGSNLGEFDRPFDIAFDSNNNIYVADFGNSRVQVFDSDGNFLFTFGSFCRIDTMENCHDPDGDGGPLQLGDGQFSAIHDIELDSNNNIYVAENGNSRVQVFDSDGNFVKSFGQRGFNSGEFSSIKGIGLDSNNNIYVADASTDKITQISFEDAIASFSEQFDEIMCNADSMINNPISVPSEITAALSISELLPRANSLTFDTQQYEEGLLFYYITSQIQPTNVNAWNGIGYTQTQICENNSAETAYKQALSIDSDNINAKIGLADFTIIQVIKEGNASILKLEDAKLQLQSVLELDSENTNALNALGYVETLRENYSMAINYYQDSLKIESKKTTTLNGLALAHLRSGDLGETTTIYLKVINIDPNNFDALVGLITTYTQQGFSELAEQFIDDLDESSSIIADKLTEQGNWLQNNGQTQEAQRLFDAAEKL